MNRLIIDNVQKAEEMALAEIPEGEIEFKKKTMLDIYREKEEVRNFVLPDHQFDCCAHLPRYTRSPE